MSMVSRLIARMWLFGKRRVILGIIRMVARMAVRGAVNMIAVAEMSIIVRELSVVGIEHIKILMKNLLIVMEHMVHLEKMRFL